MARRPHPIHLLPEAIRHAKTVCRPFERTPCVRNVLTTSSTEVPEDASECVVGIHSRLPSSIGVPLTTVLSPSLGCLSSPSPQRVVPCSPWLRAAPAAPGAGGPAHAQRSASAGGRPPSTTMMATRSVHVSWHSWVHSVPACPRGPLPRHRDQDPCCPRFTHILHPPYAAAGSTATRFPRSAACRASACHCCCPAVSASARRPEASGGCLSPNPSARAPKTLPRHESLQPARQRSPRALTRLTPSQTDRTAPQLPCGPSLTPRAHPHPDRRRPRLDRRHGVHQTCTTICRSSSRDGRRSPRRHGP